MKNLIWAIVVLLVAAGLIMGGRYSMIVSSPIVAKLDRLTGDVWIANSGMWRMISHGPGEVCAAAEKAEGLSKPAEKAN